MEEVTIKSTGTGSAGPWVLVEWPIEGCDFLDSTFLTPKSGKLDAKWIKGAKIKVPKQLLK